MMISILSECGFHLHPCQSMTFLDDLFHLSIEIQFIDGFDYEEFYRQYTSIVLTSTANMCTYSITPTCPRRHRQVRRFAASHVQWGPGKRPGLLQSGRRGVP